MIENRETFINRILYLAYKFRIRHMDFLWDGKPFDPTTQENQSFLETAPLDVLKSILDKYLESNDIIYAQEDYTIYKYYYNKKL